jgi:hypothetical protein
MTENWHGLTGAQVRDIMISILQRAEKAADAIESVDNAFVFGYYVDKEFYKTRKDDGSYDDKITDKNKTTIYYDLNNLPVAYGWDGTNFQSLETSAEIASRLNNFNNTNQKVEDVVNDKVDKVEGSTLYSADEKNKVQIVNDLTVEIVHKIGELFSLTKTDGDYSPGLYVYTGEQNQPFRRVGGLL